MSSIVSDITLPDSKCSKAIKEQKSSTYKLEIQGTHKLAKSGVCNLIFYPEGGGITCLWNAGILQIAYRMSYTKGQYSVCLPYIENQYFI
jgi:hypothetical protein